MHWDAASQSEEHLKYTHLPSFINMDRKESAKTEVARREKPECLSLHFPSKDRKKRHRSLMNIFSHTCFPSRRHERRKTFTHMEEICPILEFNLVAQKEHTGIQPHTLMVLKNNTHNEQHFLDAETASTHNSLVTQSLRKLFRKKEQAFCLVE